MIELLADRGGTVRSFPIASTYLEKLVEVVRYASFLCDSWDGTKWFGLRRSATPLDQALYFLVQLTHGSGYEHDAICRNEEVRKALDTWIANANRILTRFRRARERKAAEDRMTGEKVNALRRAKPTA